MNKFTIEIEKEICDKYLNGISGCILSKEYSANVVTIYNILDRYKIKKRSNKINSRKTSVISDYFKNIDSEEKAYWLGYIFADGCIVRNSVCISSKDTEHLEKFKRSIDYSGKIYSYKTTNGYKLDNDYSIIRIISDEVVEDLIKAGCHRRKSLILDFPYFIEELYIYHFIRGYFDGDGSIAKCSDKYKFNVKICGTKELLEGIKNKFSFKNKLSKRYKDDKNNFYVTISGNQMILFLDKIYKDCIIFLDRKMNRYLQVKENYKKICQIQTIV